MTTVTQVSQAVQTTLGAGDALSQLVGARRGYIAGIKVGDNSRGIYAAWMCSTFNLTDETGKVIKPWYSLTGKAAIGVRSEFASFKADLLAEGYAEGVEYEYWARVKDASGRPKKGGAVQGETADPKDKTRGEIGTIINRINNGRDDNTESSERMIEIYDLMCEAYATLGGVVSELKTEAKAD
jgi:hypothetical protein